MAKGKEQRSAAVDRAAEAVGHTLGSIAGTIESLQAQHPHPVDEAREALAAGQETLAAVASQTRNARPRLSRRRRRRRAGRRWRCGPPKRSAVARDRTARKVVTRARKAVTRGRKKVSRAARRLKR